MLLAGFHRLQDMVADSDFRHLAMESQVVAGILAIQVVDFDLAIPVAVADSASLANLVDADVAGYAMDSANRSILVAKVDSTHSRQSVVDLYSLPLHSNLLG